MIVAQNTTSQWFKVKTAMPAAQFFADLQAKEADDRTAGRSTWINVEPIEGQSGFGPELGSAYVRLEHVTLFGVTK